MNDLQKTEFDLLRELIRICDTLELKYYLVCGSALGAVKYGGFIPWDDDIDVALPRPDYELLCQKAPSMLPNDMFLQNFITDPNYPILSSKLRDLNTTYIEKNMQDLDIVHGVFIDVFPIDGLPNTASEQKKYLKKLHAFERRRSANLPRKYGVGIGLRSLGIYWINRLTGIYRNTGETLRKLTEYVKRYSPEKAEIWCIHHEERSLSAFNSAEWYGEGTEAVFEGLTVMIPEKYDLYLTKRYGNWRADLSDDQKVGHHYYTVCDLDLPYAEYKRRLQGHD